MAKKELVAVVKGDVSDFKAKMAQVKTTMKDLGKKFKDVGKTMSTYVTLPIIAAGAAAIKYASDFDESLNKVDVAFKTSSKGVQEWAKTTLKSFGIAEGTALDMAALFGDMATSMGLPTDKAADMSKSLVGLAGDLASFKNIGIDEAMTALNAIFTGETESLKRLGVVMTEANLAAFALSQGIKTNIKDMSQAEKVNLRYAYVMSQTANAQGDFERTGGGAANQMRIFTDSLKQLGVQFGQIILPLFTKIITKVNEWVQKFTELDSSTKKIIIIVASLAAAIGPLLVGLGFLMTTIIPALVAGGAAIATAWLPLTAIILGVMGAVYLFNKEAEKTNRLIVELAKKSTDELKARLSNLDAQLEELGGTRLKKLNEELEENKKKLEELSMEERLRSPLLIRQSELLKEITEEEKNYSTNYAYIEKLRKEKDAIKDLLKEREALATVDPPAQSRVMEQVPDLVPQIKSQLLKIEGVVAVSAKHMQQSLGLMFEGLKESFVDLSGFVQNTMMDMADFFGETLGKAINKGFSGKDFGKDFLLMVAGWAQNLGMIIVASSKALEIFKDAAIGNPAMAIPFGLALIAAGAAIRGAVNSAPMESGGGGGGSTSGGSSMSDIYGMRDLKQFEVTVSGQIYAQGTELVAVINNETNRLGY